MYHVCPVGYRQKKGSKALCAISGSEEGKPCPADDLNCCEKESAVAFRWIGIVLIIIFSIALIITLVNSHQARDTNSNKYFKLSPSYVIPFIIFFVSIIVLIVYVERAFSNDKDFKDSRKCRISIPHNVRHIHSHEKPSGHSHEHEHAWLDKSHEHEHQHDGHLPPNTMFAFFGSGEQ